MRYFMIYADKANCQPCFLDWYSKIGIGKAPDQIYGSLDERSQLSRDKSEVLKGILKQERIGETPIFRVGGVNGFCVAARLDLVESVYRGEARGMGIQEFMVY